MGFLSMVPEASEYLFVTDLPDSLQHFEGLRVVLLNLPSIEWEPLVVFLFSQAPEESDR